MNIHKILFSLALVWITLNGYSQTDFRPGYYITNEFDTIHGQIDYRGELLNGRVCSFRTNHNNKTTRIKPGDIFAYRFSQGKYYISKWVIIDSLERLVFVEYLVNGLADLYYYRDIKRDHYYIETEDGRFVELTNHEIIEKRGGITYSKPSNKYIGLLKATFANCMEIQTTINDVQLGHKSLINITSEYHNYICTDEKCIIYEKEIPLVKVTFAPLIGVGVSSIEFGTRLIYESFDFAKGFTPFVGIQIRTSMPRLNEKISLQMESGIAKNNFFYDQSVTDYWRIIHYSASIPALSLISSVSLKYTFPKGSCRPTIAIGGLSNHQLNERSGYTVETEDKGVITVEEYDSLPVAPTLWGGMAQIGINYHFLKKQIFFSDLRYQYCSGMYISNSTRTTMQSVSLVIGTYF